MRTNAAFFLFPDARAAAEAVAEELRALGQVKRLEIAGSLRRYKTHTKDADIIASTDDPDLQYISGRQDAFAHGLPAFVKTADRFDDNGIFCGARRGRRRRRTRIDAEQVETNRRAIAADHLARFEIEPRNLVVQEACAGETGERAKIDMSIVVAVMARYVSRKHAGIGRVQIPANQGDAHAFKGLHAEAAHDLDVGVAPADQDQIVRDGRCIHK